MHTWSRGTTCHNRSGQIAGWWIHMSMRVPEDVVAVKSTGNAGEYAVLRKCPAESAARLRVLEKHFVVDHAQRFGRGSCLGKSWIGQNFGYNLQNCGKTIQKLARFQLTTNNIRCMCGSRGWTILTYFEPFSGRKQGDDLGQSQPEDIKRWPRRPQV